MVFRLAIANKIYGWIVSFDNPIIDFIFEPTNNVKIYFCGIKIFKLLYKKYAWQMAAKIIY